MADIDVQTPAPNKPNSADVASDPPLCVDLDGTLIATDSLWEALLLLVRNRPGDIFRLPVWMAAGKAHFKQQIADRVELNAALLPYRANVLEFLVAEKKNGRRLVLATASHQKTANAVAAHLQLFDEVIASDRGSNLKGSAKLAELERRFGHGNFDYIGDAAADLPIWKNARRAYVVNCRGIARKASTVCSAAQVFPVDSAARSFVKALRPHQWVKNLLLFIPLILAHQIGDFHKLAQAVYAFWAFSFCASAIYIINDLLDLESDRRHPSKRRRPFAAGKLSAVTGVAMSGVLLLAAFSITFSLPLRFAEWLGLYLVLTTAYSFWLKRKLLIDVILLAGLYTQRIIAGADAVEVELTMWMLAFSMFFFLSLAFAKRYSELVQVEDSGEALMHGRGYEVRDLRIIESIGPSSGYIAVLVFCNYINELSHPVLPALAGRPSYSHPKVLWLVAPILLYWITRIWFIARRRALHDDPIIFAIRDRRSHVCGILAALVVLIAWKWH